MSLHVSIIPTYKQRILLIERRDRQFTVLPRINTKIEMI